MDSDPFMSESVLFNVRSFSVTVVYYTKFGLFCLKAVPSSRKNTLLFPPPFVLEDFWRTPPPHRPLLCLLFLLPSLYCPLLPQTAEGASNVASTFVSPISSFLSCLHLPRLFSILLSTSPLSRSFSPSFPPRSVALPPSSLPPSCTGAVFLSLFLCLLSQRAQVCARACLVVFFLSLTDTLPHRRAVCANVGKALTFC